MKRKKYYGIMFCVVSVSKFVMPAQAGRRSPAVQASYGTFSESDQKRLYALEKQVRLLNEQFHKYCVRYDQDKTHNLKQFQTQTRVALNQQQAIQQLQHSLVHEESKQDIQLAIQELQGCVLQLDQEQAVTEESVATLRNIVHLLIVQTVDDIRRHQDELYQQQQSNRRSVVLRGGGGRSSLRRSRAMDELHQQNGGWFVSDSEEE